jgi:Tol biopolymer transport system component
MTMRRYWRRYWLMACAGQLGLVAGLGCGARDLDPTDPNMPGHDGGGTTSYPVDAWIAFDSDGGSGRDIWVRRLDGSIRRRLTTETATEAQPAFSYDRTKLAYASDRDGGVMQIYVMSLANGVAARVTQRPEGAHHPAFSRDGTRVGYRSGDVVFTALLDGSDERQATDGSFCCVGATSFGGPVFSTDGESLIYDDYNAIYALSGTTRRTIVGPTTGEQSHPALSLDGSTIVLQSTCLGDDAARSLWLVPATSTTNLSCTGGQRISEQGTDATGASWGPNNMIVFGSVTGGNNNTSPVPSDLVLWQDGALRTLEHGTGDNRNPSWSPLSTVIGDW